MTVKNLPSRIVQNFDEYADFVGSIIAGWKGYRKGDDGLKLEEIFGEPKSYPAEVFYRRVWEDEGECLGTCDLQFGTLETVPTFVAFERDTQ